MSKKRRKRKNSNYQKEVKTPPKKKLDLLQILKKHKNKISCFTLSIIMALVGHHALKETKKENVEDQSDELAIELLNELPTTPQTINYLSNTVNLNDLVFTSEIEKIEEEMKKAEEEQARLKAQERQKELEYQQRIEKHVMYDDYLKEYSSYFNFDSDKIIALARVLTHNYEIGFDNFINNPYYNLENPETACMLFVYHIYHNQKFLNIERENYENYFANLSTTDEKRTLSTSSNFPDLYSYSSYLGSICDLLEMDKNYSLSISFLETGRITSNLAQNYNNFGGLRNKNGFMSFPTPEAGIIAFCTNLKNYEKYNIKNINELSGIYVHGRRTEPAPTWISNVLGFYRTITENPDVYFGKTQKQTLERKL